MKSKVGVSMLEVTIQKQLAHFPLDVSFTMRDEIVVLFGPSGAGKTTILNCIAGLTNPDGGKIVLNDQPFFHSPNNSLPTQRRNIGYLFQDYALFPHMTVEKNIYYGVKKTTVKVNTIIEQLTNVLGIEHLLNKYPHQISGGEKQRVALARALATEPSILLLDEPLSALDKQTRIECQNELIRIHEMWKIPFIIVTHDQDEAEKLGHRMLMMEQGKVNEERRCRIST